LLGHLVGLLTTLKGLPSSYDKDLQEDKEPVFDAFDTLSQTVPIMAGLLRTLQLRPARMVAQLEPNLLATDLADYLVKRGVPFRQAHHLVGEVVQLAENRGVPLTELTVADLQSVSEEFDEGATAVFNFKTSLSNRAITGGTSPQALQAQLSAARQKIS
jgi:argininosuccinate lyase